MPNYQFKQPANPPLYAKDGDRIICLTKAGKPKAVPFSNEDEATLFATNLSRILINESR